MKKEIVVNSTPNEIRIGIVEDGELVELLGDSADSTRMVGNVYLGKVTAVRPGLQAAFVDIGYEKAGFLHVSDLVHEEPEETKSDNGGERRRGRGREGMRPIERMIREGDEILVQVVKEALGTKGPRLTADISLPGRFLVLMPKGKHVGVSRKIGDRHERARLKAMLSAVKPERGAFIIRTAGEGIDEKMLRKDVEYLTETLRKIEERAKEVTAPAIVHEDVGLIVGLIRDVLTEDVHAVHIDNEVDYKRLVEYVKTFSPKLLNRIKLYRGDVSLFDKFDIESELKKSLERKVWMKKGGYIVIDQTEALVAIDVNTGRFTGKRNQEETIFKTNMMAAREVPRQLRLRNIGGIVVIDFIDMESEANKRKVLNELRTYLKRDRARTKTFTISDLGLVEMSRQRVRESLQSRLSDACPFCKGSGYVLSLETLANKVERLLSKCGLTTRETTVQVQANPSLAVHLLTERGAAIEKIARDFNMKIDILDDARIHREDFRIVSLRSRKDLTSQLENAAWKGTVNRRPAAAHASEEGATERRSRGRGRGRDRGRGRSDSAHETRRESASRLSRRDEGRSEARDEGRSTAKDATSRSDSGRSRGRGGRRTSGRETTSARPGRPEAANEESRSAGEAQEARRSSSSSRSRSSTGRGGRSSSAGRGAGLSSAETGRQKTQDAAAEGSPERKPAPVSATGEGTPSGSSTRRRRRGRRGRGRGRGKRSQEGTAPNAPEASAEAVGSSGGKPDASVPSRSEEAPARPPEPSRREGPEVPARDRTRSTRHRSSVGSAERKEAPSSAPSAPSGDPAAPSSSTPAPVRETPTAPPAGERPASASDPSSVGGTASASEKPKRRGRRPRRVVRR